MSADKRTIVILISFLSMSFVSGLWDSWLDWIKDSHDEPVSDAVTKIKYGTDGTTVVTSEGRKFVIKDNDPYKCTGTISDSDGSCSGNLEKLSFDYKKDVCFSKPQHLVNNWYCFSISDSIDTGFVNGKAYCTNKDGKPAVLISSSDYNSMCDAVAKDTTYKYFTHAEMPEEARFSCTRTGLIVCTYSP